jgi:cell wall-associated NlpC family hydrolase
MSQFRLPRSTWIATGLLVAALSVPAAVAQQVDPSEQAGAAQGPEAATISDSTTAKSGSADFAAEAVRATQQIASYAMQFVGTAYRFGGTEPAIGFDCSGLVQYVYRQVTGVTLPRTARSLSQVGLKIPTVNLLPGDLVFFNTRRFAFSHVGIYIGNNQFVHAPRSGERVEVSTIDSHYWQRRFNGARRLVGDMPGLLPDLVSEASTAATAAFMSDPPESERSLAP